MPVDVKQWLKGGEQSKLTPMIREIAKGLRGRNRRESLYDAMDYVWRNFSYDKRLNSAAFTRTSGEIVESRALGGCSDFALALITLFRAVGIPSRMVITVNVDWMLSHRSNKTAMSEGHSFIEVYLEEGWYLVDPTYRFLFSGYTPDEKSYPHGEYFCARGKDFWDMGIKSVAELESFLREQALKYRDDYRIPPYEREPV
ncbi:MAG: transglutaminase domain-containing protein [Deltaproteobacteria bacterium]|nr:transglutaminase domain-containing protein [Deltaproteobacteria bacterium]